jgi:hypothetical protein
MGFNERPMRHYPAFMAQRPADQHRRCKPLNIRNNPNLSSLHNFIQNRQPAGLKARQVTNLVLLSHDICLRIVHLQNLWWRRTGSNRRPPACKAGALPAELRPRKVWVNHPPSRAPSKPSFASATARRGSCRALAEHRGKDPLMRER